jgi:hypothetical protein
MFMLGQYVWVHSQRGIMFISFRFERGIFTKEEIAIFDYIHQMQRWKSLGSLGRKGKLP